MSFVAGLSGTVDFEDGQKGKSTTSGRMGSKVRRKQTFLFCSHCLKEREGTKALPSTLQLHQLN